MLAHDPEARQRAERHRRRRAERRLRDEGVGAGRRDVGDDGADAVRQAARRLAVERCDPELALRRRRLGDAEIRDAGALVDREEIDLIDRVGADATDRPPRPVEEPPRLPAAAIAAIEEAAPVGEPRHRLAL
ncbi:MAG: hypothetical protein MUF40_07495, partial [Gemmatimonadaceae bacterium]|nr:hypothetical protein [Gemmatimonadaceae bacterium]